MTTPTAKSLPLLLWLDLETTGLDPSRDVILEVACVLTTPDLVEIEAYETVVQGLIPEAYDEVRIRAFMEPVVLDMHRQNGLIEALRSREWPALLEAHEAIMKMIRRHTPDRVMLAGSSVHFDRGFLEAHDRAWVERTFSHRHLDVSVVNVAMDAWRPGLRYVASSDAAAHRAMADIRHSLEAARHYRRVFGDLAAV